MEKELTDFRKQYQSGFRYFFHLFYPRVSFLLDQAGIGADAREQLAITAFIQLNGSAPLLHSMTLIADFLYRSASASATDLKRKQEYLASGKSSMGYNLGRNRRNDEMNVVYVETMYLLYKDFTVPGQYHEKETPSISGDNKNFPDAASPETAALAPDQVPALLSGMVWAHLSGQKELSFSTQQQQQINSWLGEAVQRQLVYDELRLSANIQRAKDFFSTVDSDRAYSIVKSKIKFARPPIIAALRRLLER